MIGFKNLFGDYQHVIIELFKKAESGTFVCDQCKREGESEFNPVFLAYGTKRTTCQDCEAKIEKAIREQKISDKMKALERFESGQKGVVDSMIYNSGVPDIFLNACMNDLGKASAKTFDVDQSYFLNGDVGVGKSHMAVALMRQYLESLKPAYDEQKQKYYFDDFTDKLPCFIEVPELLLRIRDTYRSHTGTYIDKGIETEKDIVDLFSRAPFLVLDDLGSEKASEFSTLMLYLIINRRCTSGKATIITSNLSIEEIGEHLSSRVSSRIKGMCKEINVSGNDRRYEHEPQQGSTEKKQH